MRKISVMNLKGGVGKTSLVINVGHKLALDGLNVLIVDCDLQANASTLLENPRTPTLTSVLREAATARDAIQNARENLDILPADANLDKASIYISSSGTDGYYILKNEIKKIEALGAYDFVFFDHSPSFSAVAEAALLASEEVIIPCELGTFSIEGLMQMIDSKVNTAMAKRNHTLVITGIVPTRYNGSISMHETYLRDLQENFTEGLMPKIRQDSAIGKSQHFHQSVFEYDPKSRAAEDFTAIANLLKEGTVNG